jgi:mannose-6-phosphate isomerase
MDTPLKFTPFLRPMVWGGRRLQTVLGKPLPDDRLYGESWEVSDHPLHRSVVAAGPCEGKSVRELMESNALSLLGRPPAPGGPFPWLVKFLDAADWLSVQVHPDTEAVKHLCPGEGSKTEAWFVVAASPGSRIYAGLLPGVDEKRLRQALENGTAARCLHSWEPRAGECVFLPAGTIHAVGGGVLIAEVQETSDATFRIYDWDRRDAQGKSRTLHMDQGLASINWDQGIVEPIRAGDSLGLQRLISCRFFELEYRRAGRPFSCGGTGKLQVVMVLKGKGSWQLPDGEERITTGDVWVVPASMPAVTIRPDAELETLVSTLP